MKANKKKIEALARWMHETYRIQAGPDEIPQKPWEDLREDSHKRYCDLARALLENPPAVLMEEICRKDSAGTSQGGT